MKTLYLDIFSGISGDMFIGALLDLGVDPPRLERELRKLGAEGYHLHAVRSQKSGIAGVKFDVHLHDHHEHESDAGHEHSHAHSHEHTHSHSHAHAHAHSHSHGEEHEHHHEHEHGHDHEHGHHHAHTHSHIPAGAHGGPLVVIGGGHVELSVFETNVPPRFRLYFHDSNGKPSSPPPAKTVQLETVRPDGATHVFRFKSGKGYLEATEELPEPHEFTALLTVGSRGNPETIRTPFVEEHSHEHHSEHAHHDHEHSHEDAHAASDHDHADSRDFKQIKAMIRSSGLSDWVKEKSVAVFRRIAVAEGKVHGIAPEEVHFHEVGALDSIVDIVGGCIGLELLGKPRVLAAAVVEGTGFVHCAHGRFPIPAPATLAILGERGVAVSQTDEPHELVTPTGAALLAEFVESFGPMQNLVAEKIGFGLGTRDNVTRPNVLRAIFGESAAPAAAAAHDWEIDTIAVLETNLDDINAEILGHFVERALKSGALDVFHTPIQMKKNRPGVMLTVLCAEADADRFSEMILRETGTFGVRRHAAERRKLQREFSTVSTPYGEATLKLGKLDGKVLHATPEFESCKALAEKAGVPLKDVYDAASRAAGR
jgi:uncharacterized protein (TIGR00299 family) protein